MTSQTEVGTDWVREQLKHGEPVYFIEVRHAGDRDLAVMKARGALRLTSDQASNQIQEIPKKGTLVVYSSAPDDEPAKLFAHQLEPRSYGGACPDRRIQGVSQCGTSGGGYRRRKKHVAPKGPLTLQPLGPRRAANTGILRFLA